jgi:hypothetical protein
MKTDIRCKARCFVVGLAVWYHAEFHWFSGNFRLQALGVVLLIYWIFGCLIVFTRRRDETGVSGKNGRAHGREELIGESFSSREKGAGRRCQEVVFGILCSRSIR